MDHKLHLSNELYGTLPEDVSRIRRRAREEQPYVVWNRHPACESLHRVYERKPKQRSRMFSQQDAPPPTSATEGFRRPWTLSVCAKSCPRLLLQHFGASELDVL